MSLPRISIGAGLLLASLLALLLARAIPTLSNAALRLDTAIAAPTNETQR